MGHRAKRVRHQIQAENCNKRIGPSRLRHGIHSDRTCSDHSRKDDLPIWKLSIDGASNAQGSGAGLILTSPEGIDIEYALRFGFHASKAEYEAVVAGLNLAHSLEVDQLEINSDSQLVVRQIEDTYEAKSERMILYL